MIKMVSIDSSTKKTGVAIFENGVYSAFKLIDLSHVENIDSRFKEMSCEIWRILDHYSPTLIYVEETVVVRNAQTQRFLTRLQGVIYGWCIMNSCEFNTIRPTEFRKELGFKQGRNVKREELKQQSVSYVKEHFGLDVNDDVADAICIGSAIVKIFDKLEEEKYGKDFKLS